MSFTPVVLALGFILIFVVLVYLAIRTSRKYQAQKNQYIRELGFEAPESAPTGLITRVEELYRTRQVQELSLQGVFHRRDLDQDLYIFDIINTQGDDSEMGQEVFGAISSELALPRFSLTTIPDFDRESLIGGLMDVLLDKVTSLAEKHLNLQRVEFPDRPEIDDRLIVFGRDPYAVRELLERLPLSSLGTSPLPIQIAGSGDFLTVDFSVSGNLGDEDQDLLSQYRQFREILQIFTR